MTITEQIHEALYKHIHVCECSDEGGWFAYLEPDGVFDDVLFECRVNGFETPSDAIAALIKSVAEEVKFSYAVETGEGLPLTTTISQQNKPIETRETF